MSTVRRHLFLCVVQIMKLRRNIFAFARKLHDSLDYIKDSKKPKIGVEKDEEKDCNNVDFDNDGRVGRS